MEVKGREGSGDLPTLPLLIPFLPPFTSIPSSSLPPPPLSLPFPFSPFRGGREWGVEGVEMKGRKGEGRRKGGKEGGGGREEECMEVKGGEEGNGEWKGWR